MHVHPRCRREDTSFHDMLNVCLSELLFCLQLSLQLAEQGSCSVSRGTAQINDGMLVDVGSDLDMVSLLMHDAG